MRISTLFSLILLWIFCSGARLLAGDWPQILGPDRNGVAQDEELFVKWPANGPKKNWTHPLGAGFAGVAVSGSNVIAFHRIDDQDLVECIDATSGKTRWRASFEADYRGGVNPDLGPRCVPLIHEGRVYAFSADGDLHCVLLKDGSKAWSREAYVDFDGDEGYFGAGSTPIAVGKNIVVNVGGSKNAGLVAFDAASGETRWQGTMEKASYSSPALATIGGRPQVIFVTRLNTMGVDPATGKVGFQFPFGRRGPTVNAATPLVIGDQLFVTASYQIGARMVKLPGKTGQTSEIWASDDVLSSQYSTAVHRDGHLYGFHGREDIGQASLRCVTANTGKVVWSQDNLPVGHVLVSKDLLLTVSVEGHVSLVRASPRGYEELASARVVRGTTRALPALSHGQLLLRTNAGQTGQLISLEVGK